MAEGEGVDVKFIAKRWRKRMKLRDAILIEGLPGMGHVARIATSFLIERLKPTLYATIYSYAFPNSVWVDEQGLVELPKVDIYCMRRKGKRDLVFVISDTPQPPRTEDSYRLSEVILDIAEELGVKQIITLGGYGCPYEPTDPKVYAAATHRSILEKLKKKKVKVDRRGITMIIGAAGLLLGLGKLRGMEGFALLAETSSSPYHHGVRAAKAVLEQLFPLIEVELPLKELEEEIKRIEEEKRMGEEMDVLMRAIEEFEKGRRKRTIYIG